MEVTQAALDYLRAAGLMESDISENSEIWRLATHDTSDPNMTLDFPDSGESVKPSNQ
jgi:hypothetical protein